MMYLNENNLIYKLQAAFRIGHSTETALFRMSHEFLFKTGLVFIDFKEAFDVIWSLIIIFS